MGAAADDDQAIETAAHRLPDVVLMDLRMPQMDGSEAARRLLERYPDIQM